MKKMDFVVMMIAAMLVLSTAAIGAEVSASPPMTAPEGEKNGFEQFRDGFHQPTDYLKMGFDFRFRTIFADNIDTLDSDATGRDSYWEFQRYRSRWWTKWDLSEDVKFNTRLTWEFRTWDHPDRQPSSVEWDEALFDIFNLEFRNLGDDDSWRMVAGRQDIYDINPWLILDGTPLDGSRTIFFDALRLTWLSEGDVRKLDLIYVDQAADSDRWLKPINDQDKHVTEQDEYGAILYYTDNTLENTQLEGYFIYKNDNAIQGSEDFPNGPPFFPSSANWSKKAEIYTFGGALQHDFDESWRFRGDYAFQTGDKETVAGSGDMDSLRAFGTKNDLEFKFNDELDNRLHATYEFLSGDDGDTSRNEQFDPLWGEWPQWSELYIYTYSRETMIAETTNLHRFTVGHKFSPTKKLQMVTDYHLLWADESNETTTGADTFTFGEGSFRGQLVTWWLKYKLTKCISGHLNAEYLIPGDYYADSNRDEAYWFRFNIEYTF